jgi:hypothetical protein
MARIDAELCAPRGALPSLEPGNSQAESLTLLDLVRAVAEFAESEAEVVAVVEHLLESGRVVLAGHFLEPRLLTN